MKSVAKFWNGGLLNKVVASLILLIPICSCCTASFLLMTPPAPIPIMPTFDQALIGTYIAQTAMAINTQPLSIVETDTGVPASTLASTITPLPTDTPFVYSSPAITMSGPVFTISTAACVPKNPPQIGEVIEVVDGDTIKVKLQDGQVYSVRYIGMDTPENTTEKEYFGPESTAKNYELVAGKTVVMYSDVSNTDQYGRLLRYVFVGNTFVDYELVAQGYATAVAYPPDIACNDYFSTGQTIAMTNGYGLWSGVTPTLIVVIPTSSSGGGVCSCSGNLYNCKSFSSRSQAQTCFNYCISVGSGDVHRLDGDNNGLVCEDTQY